MYMLRQQFQVSTMRYVPRLKSWHAEHGHDNGGTTNSAGNDYELVTSPAVLDELTAGLANRSTEWLALVRDLPLLPVEKAISEIVQTYVRHKIMPSNPSGDALHLALASYHKCEFLVTWNCKHLANANKFGHIRRVNGMLGLFVPALVTPLELLGGRDERDSE